jgi:hypothetical protein
LPEGIASAVFEVGVDTEFTEAVDGSGGLEPLLWGMGTEEVVGALSDGNWELVGAGGPEVGFMGCSDGPTDGGGGMEEAVTGRRGIPEGKLGRFTT